MWNPSPYISSAPSYPTYFCAFSVNHVAISPLLLCFASISVL
uniref:Uncharacterized protein n=1 Tax=Chlamydia pneumoniae TaxID=83558 RepID=A0A0F7XP14_CHLPN|nr:hypothetical protein BN1224_PB1_B_00440 [Chlamydia pneumoniae]